MGLKVIFFLTIEKIQCKILLILCKNIINLHLYLDAVAASNEISIPR
jgi:hypothetical protein